VPESRLKVVIAAENIPGTGAGLGYFLYTAVGKLAEAQPAWRFKVIASSSFRELEAIKAPNVKVIFWDRTLPQRAAAKFITRFFPGGADAGNQLLSRLVPSRWLKGRLGDLKSLYRSLSGVDVIWLPHYAITGGRFSSFNNLGTVSAPILFTIHDLHPVFFPDDWSQDDKHNFWNGFVPFARYSRRIITHSQFQRSAIIEHLKIGPDKVLVTPCPPLIDGTQLLERCDPTETALILAKLNATVPFALYPGSGGHTHKNHARLLLSWAKLKGRLGSRCPMLVCTARGHHWPALKALVDALELQNNVTFTGTVDTGSLARLYQNCEFVIVPTLYEGGGSGPVAEALITGKPVICSKIPPIEEQFRACGIDLVDSGATFFKPDSVDGIVQAVESVLMRLPELETQARQTQSRLLEVTPGLWSEWAGFYSRQLSMVAEQHRNNHND
jgi:glycosyltransferase involved in cell wall biosynthesis